VKVDRTERNSGTARNVRPTKLSVNFTQIHVFHTQIEEHKSLTESPRSDDPPEQEPCSTPQNFTEKGLSFSLFL
jgi:hypothetical protein